MVIFFYSKSTIETSLALFSSPAIISGFIKTRLWRLATSIIWEFFFNRLANRPASIAWSYLFAMFQFCIPNFVKTSRYRKIGNYTFNYLSFPSHEANGCLRTWSFAGQNLFFLLIERAIFVQMLFWCFENPIDKRCLNWFQSVKKCFVTHWKWADNSAVNSRIYSRVGSKL